MDYQDRHVVVTGGTGALGTAVVGALLEAGANPKAKDMWGKTALDYAQDNENLKGTVALRQLQEASR